VVDVFSIVQTRLAWPTTLWLMYRSIIVGRDGRPVEAPCSDRTPAHVDRGAGRTLLAEAEADEKVRARLAGTVHRIDTFWLSVARSRETRGRA
jgi:hypothetical protein